MPNAGLSELNSDGELAAREIRFIYVACGAVRGNQISDNEQEDSERALYVTVDGSKLRFEYCGRDGNIFDRTALAGPKEAAYFENFRTLASASAAGLTVDIAAEADESVIRRGDFFLGRPIAGQQPGGVTSFSKRYETSLEWRNSKGQPVTGDFQHGETYTARLTLRSGAARFDLTGADVYVFDEAAVSIPSELIAAKMVSVSGDGSEAVVEVIFAPTSAMAEVPLAAAGEIEPGKRYVLTSDTQQYCFTCARADCVAEDGRLLTVPDTGAWWSFEPQGEGYAMRSASGQYLTAGINGPHVVLTPVKDLADGTYTEWRFTEGVLSIDVNGYEYIMSCKDGEFALLTSGGEACRLYEVS